MTSPIPTPNLMRRGNGSPDSPSIGAGVEPVGEEASPPVDTRVLANEPIGQASEATTLLESEHASTTGSSTTEDRHLGVASDPTPEGARSTSTPPETGDLVVDAALQDLGGAAHDLDEQLEAAERLHRTLHSRLADLGE